MNSVNSDAGRQSTATEELDHLTHKKGSQWNRSIEEGDFVRNGRATIAQKADAAHVGRHRYSFYTWQMSYVYSTTGMPHPSRGGVYRDPPLQSFARWEPGVSDEIEMTYP